MNNNRATIKTRDTSVMSGIDKHITTSITISGTPYTPADLKAVFQSQITALDTSDALRKSLADSVVNAKAIATKVTALYHLLRQALIAQYGKNANAVLNDFGMTAPKVPGAKTVEAKATAAAKRTATRTARHTMGTVQKKAVTGSVVGITVTPVVAGPPVTATQPVAPTSPVVATSPTTPAQPVAPPAPTSPATGATGPVAPVATPTHA
jgi:hypothetical protein